MSDSEMNERAWPRAHERSGESPRSGEPGEPLARLAMREIRKSFAGVEVLHGVDFELRGAEVHALVGENGAGKSTLMKILAGEIPADAGEIELDGERASFRTPHAAQLAGVSMIHQELSYVPRLSVAENLHLGRLPRDRFGRVRWATAYRQSSEQLEGFGVEIDPRASMDTLSLAARQVVEIVRAVRHRARILIMDEPTASLGSHEVDTLFDVIRRLRDQGVAIIYISHHLDEIFSIGERVTVLRDGRRVSSRSVSDSNRPQLIREMVGADVVAFQRSRRIGHDESPMLTVRDLRVGGVRDVSFAIGRGEALGLYGLVGAGQELIARTLAGIVAPDGGEIHLDGRQFNPRSPRAAIAAGVGFVPSDRKVEGLAPRMSVRGNLTLPSLELMSRVGIVRGRHERAVAEKASSDVRIKATGIAQPVAFLSGGNQQKVVLGRWFVREMKLLVLADPTRGVDVGAKSDIYALISSLSDAGVSVLIVSSDLPELLSLCDRIAVLVRGRLVRELDASQASQEDVLGVAAGGVA